MSYYVIERLYFKCIDKEQAMISAFLIVLGILTLFGAGDAGDACLIVILLKLLPIILIAIGLLTLVMCSH